MRVKCLCPERESIVLLPASRSLARVRRNTACSSPGESLTSTYQLARPAEAGIEKADARKYVRYPRIFSVALRWTSKTGKQLYSDGLTRDISAGGVFVFTNKYPQRSSIVHYEVYVQSPQRRGSILRIAGFGEILRVQRLTGGQWHGVAIGFSGHTVRVAGS